MTKEQIEKAANEYVGFPPEMDEGVGTTMRRKAFRDGAEWRIESVWHPGIDATMEKPALIEYPHVDGGIGHLVVQDVREFADIITRFAYIDDLLPERKEESK